MEDNICSLEDLLEPFRSEEPRHDEDVHRVLPLDAGFAQFFKCRRRRSRLRGPYERSWQYLHAPATVGVVGSPIVVMPSSRPITGFQKLCFSASPRLEPILQLWFSLETSLVQRDKAQHVHASSDCLFQVASGGPVSPFRFHALTRAMHDMKMSSLIHF